MTQVEDPELFYDCHVFCCTNVRPANHPRGSCARKGSVPLRDKLKSMAKELGLSRVRINSSGCLDRCEHGPTMVIYPEGLWYRYETEADLAEILNVHIKAGGRVPRLMLSNEDRPLL